MLSIYTSTQTLFVTFTEVISVLAAVGTDTSVPVADVPTVVPSFADPGISITTSTAEVTISGSYQTIIPITWYWKDLNDQLQSGNSVPPVGSYEKIVQVDSPSSLSTTCSYTIISSSGVDTFIHEVTLGSYSTIKTALDFALAGQPTPLMP